MKSVAILYLILSLLSCDKADKAVEPNTIDAQTISNVAYGSESKQKMDIYLPANRNSTDTKLIVLIHGGGWSAGDKQDFNTFIAELQRRLPNYAIANLNYQLAENSNNLFPTQENDIENAIAFLVSKSAEYKISKRYALLGASAGAHLALLHAYKHNTDSHIKAVISLFGPTELVSLYNDPIISSLPLLLSGVLGGTPTTKPAIYQQSSPYNFVSAQSCPTLLFHGGADQVIPASQSTILRDKLAANGVSNQYVFYPTEGHGWIGVNLTDSFDKVVAFLQQHMP